MAWENWHNAFSDLEIPGLAYRGCCFAVCYYQYAARGNRANPQLARSQSVVSEWDIEDSNLFPDLRPFRTARIFFPVYDGIGFWIGKRRREGGVQHYTNREEVAIAQASAIGALGIEHAFASPNSSDHMVYRCIWAPGKALDKDGAPLVNTTNTALGALGLEIHEVTTPTRTFRVYGDSRTLQPESGAVINLRFTPGLAAKLLPVWKHMSNLLTKPDPPPDGLY